MFKRKIYNKIKEWKDTSQGKTALLIEGARRIGKSTVVEEFARNEYKSYIFIDFLQKSRQCSSRSDLDKRIHTIRNHPFHTLLPLHRRIHLSAKQFLDLRRLCYIFCCHICDIRCGKCSQFHLLQHFSKFLPGFF